MKLSLYALNNFTDDWTTRMREAAPHAAFHFVSTWSSLDIAQHMRQAKVDIAVDLNGYGKAKLLSAALSEGILTVACGDGGC